MSKRNLLLGTAAGKVGDLVFYRAGGEQRTRAKVTPNNPKTYAQQAQRSRLANVTLMYRALSALMKDSFTSRPSNQTAFNAFSADALPIAPFLEKSRADKGQFYLEPALVAKGSVPVPFASVTTTGGVLSVVMEGNFEGPITDTDGLAEALKAWRPCCFQDGGSLIFALLYKPQGNTERYVAKYVVIDMSGNNTQALADLGVTAQVTPAQGDDPGSLTLTLAVSGTDFGGAVIVNRPKADGGYDVTDSRLVLDSVAKTAYETHITADAARDAAISYGGVEGSCVVNG